MLRRKIKHRLYQRVREIAAARLAGAGLGNIKADVHGSLFPSPWLDTVADGNLISWHESLSPKKPHATH
jgi:hypothetical protein